MFFNTYLIKFCTNFIKHTYVGLGNVAHLVKCFWPELSP